MRFVVLPQAIRRVLPPLLNDFIGLQKDSALIGVLGVTEGLRQAQIASASYFNFTPYVSLALVYVTITIPQVLFVDWLIKRDKRRRQAGRSHDRSRYVSRGSTSRSAISRCCGGIDLVVDAHQVVCSDRRVGFGQIDASSMREPAGDDRRGHDRDRRGRRHGAGGRPRRDPAAASASSSSPSTCSRT